MSPFSREKALYLVDNPTKLGFSWWFFFAGIFAGYCMNHIYGDNAFIIEVVNKYIFLLSLMLLTIPRRYIEKKVRLGSIKRDSKLVYLVLPAGLISTLTATMVLSHAIFAIFIN